MTCLWHVVLWQIASVIVRTVRATCSSLSLGSFRFTTRQLDDLKWLVRKPRQTGGVSYSSALTYGLSTGRGWKPYQAPRKREDANILLPITLERFQGPDLQKIGIFFHDATFAQFTPFPESILQFYNILRNEQFNYSKEQSTKVSTNACRLANQPTAQ